LIRPGHIKLLSRLALVLAICLMAIILPAVAAQAQNGAPIPYVGLSPSIGIPGTEVRINGGNFTPDEWIAIYYYLNGARIRVAEVQANVDGYISITFEVPDSFRGSHAVRAEETTTLYAQGSFTVQSGLTVSPEEGRVDGIVTVIGRGYGQNETGIRLYFGGQRILEDVPIEADADGSWSEMFEIPQSTGGIRTIDTVPAANVPATFTVIPGITADRSSGSPGDSLLMTGGGFTANERNISILFGVEAVVTGIRSDDKGHWEEAFQVPEMPAGKYAVTAEGDRTLKADVGTVDFEVKPGIALSPDEGHVGMNVTATGRGFAANEEVTVFYEDYVSANTTTNENGSFEVTFAVPESQYGDREVTAEDAEGNETGVPAIFTMEDDPPDTPKPISPIDGQRVGFARRVRPTFKWEEVFDLSGVSYTLQISTSANFTDPMVIEDISGNYTLGKDKALPHGTYYWIVRAVDGAQNESGWSDPESFRAGRLPLWAFIVIIVFAVLGAGGVFYYYRVRRTLYD
jgi:hypothetical protein